MDRAFNPQGRMPHRPGAPEESGIRLNGRAATITYLLPVAVSVLDSLRLTHA